MSALRHAIAFYRITSLGGVAASCGIIRENGGVVEPTAEPDALGRVKTTFRDTNGRTTGTGVASVQPDALGRTTTVLRDTQGKRSGTAVSRPPDALGRVKTEVTGKVPLAGRGGK